MKQRTSFFSIYGISAIVTAALLGLVGFSLGLDALLTMVTLMMLEVTFSLDNAVVNATVLRHMNQFWQRMFVTVGIIIAVFGMRLLFPILLVSATASMAVSDVVVLALQHPGEYSTKLTVAEPTIAAFGGMFLLMIFLSFVFDEARPSAWQHLLKHALKKMSTLRFTEIFIACIVLLVLIMFTQPAVQLSVAVAGLVGISAHLVVGTLADIFNARQGKRIGRPNMPWHAGLITFLYLELLDASFSFDSVIAAFAITANAILIVAGLGAGALWVRSITIYLVRRGTLATYPYLDAGAHYAMGALAVMLLIGIRIELPDLLTGSIGLVIIAMAFVASICKNRADRARGRIRRAVRSGV